METNLMQTLVSLGVGGVIAAIVLVWKRADDQRYAADMKDMAGRFEGLSKDVLNALREHICAIKDVATALDRLSGIDGLEKRLAAMERKIGKTTPKT